MKGIEMTTLEDVQKARELRHAWHCGREIDENELYMLTGIDVLDEMAEASEERAKSEIDMWRDIAEERHAEDGHECEDYCRDAVSDMTNEKFWEKNKDAIQDASDAFHENPWSHYDSDKDDLNEKLKDAIAEMEAELSDEDKKIIQQEKKEYAQYKQQMYWKKMQDRRCDCGSGMLGYECCYESEEDE